MGRMIPIQLNNFYNFYNSLNPRSIFIDNRFFSVHFILKSGILLGGHLRLLSHETSSIIYGIRTQNLIINLNKTSVELIKIFKIIEGLGHNRTIVFFVNSMLNLRFAVKTSWSKYNLHLFFLLEKRLKITLPF